MSVVTDRASQSNEGYVDLGGRRRDDEGFHADFLGDLAVQRILARRAVGRAISRGMSEDRAHRLFGFEEGALD